MSTHTAQHYIVVAKNNLQISKLYLTLQKKRSDGREARRLIANQYTGVRFPLPPLKYGQKVRDNNKPLMICKSSGCSFWNFHAGIAIGIRYALKLAGTLFGEDYPTDRKNRHKFFNIAISDTAADCQSPQVKLIYNEKDIVWMKIPLALGLFIG